MIRRGFWLVAGAVLGVTGYRKVTRMTQALTGRGKPRRPATVLTPAIQAMTTPRLALTSRPATGRAESGHPETGRLRRRLAADRGPADHGPADRGAAGRAAADRGPVDRGPADRAERVRGGTATAIARAASAAGFIRDVREGMAEYRDLHRRGFDHTLGSRSGRISPAESRQGRREP